MRVGLGALCNGKTDANLRVTARGPSGDLNEARFTVNDLMASRLMFPGQNKGQLVFLKFELVTMPSFLDYLRAGW